MALFSQHRLGDRLNVKLICCLLDIGVFTVCHLVVVLVQSIGSDKECRRQDVSFNGLINGYVGVSLRFFDNLKLTNLVFEKMVFDCPPWRNSTSVRMSR
ncbi:hypothetical protein V6N13_123352 [Hibiscus sabdariffa]|uniref:Transmembrane protein n=1 Tax=Hibiscus sabdariffa TaxID=183260 RepID=A0ABR2A9R6_9ROSI